MNPYEINYVGLGLGQHEFEYGINDRFFESLDYSPIKKGELQVKLILDKRENLFTLHFNITGTLMVACDRCTEAFELPVANTADQIVKFGEGHNTDNDEIIILGKNEYKIDLAPLLYEFILLAVPLIHYHPDKADGTPGCDPEVLKDIQRFVNENKEEQDSNDPRWDALKNIKLN